MLATFTALAAGSAHAAAPPLLAPLDVNKAQGWGEPWPPATLPVSC